MIARGLTDDEALRRLQNIEALDYSWITGEPWEEIDFDTGYYEFEIPGWDKMTTKQQQKALAAAEQTWTPPDIISQALHKAHTVHAERERAIIARFTTKTELTAWMMTKTAGIWYYNPRRPTTIEKLLGQAENIRKLNNEPDYIYRPQRRQKEENL